MYANDTGGNMVTEFIDAPVTLQPWATEGFVLERTDKAGSIGANFIVDWEAGDPVSEPVIETVIVSTSGTQALGSRRGNGAKSCMCDACFTTNMITMEPAKYTQILLA